MKEQELQAAYYTQTASQYDKKHLAENDEHYEALHLIIAFCSSIGARSILDVGAGTGRAMIVLREHGFEVRGIEPVKALRQQAFAKGVASADLLDASGEKLPFPDESFDAVIETGVLHHAKHPDKIVAEMCRVARMGVFLSDENRFAYGNVLRRFTTYTLYQLGLFKAAYKLYTRGKGYRWSKGDGLAYSYSVYDNLPQLAEWSNRLYTLPLKEEPKKTFLQPFFTHFHVLLAALRLPS